MWWAVAAAAAPYVVAALQKKPKRPGAPAAVPLRNRDGSVNQMMDSAFNPDSETYRLAAEYSANQVNHILARQGFAGSSVGAQLQQGTQAKLAQAWLAEQSQRQNQAMQTAMNYDKGQAGWQQDQNDAQYNYAMDGYKDAQQRNSNQVAGISNMVGVGLGAYNQSQMMDRMDSMRSPQVSNVQMEPMPIYGSPGPSPYDPGGAYAPSGAYGMRPGGY